MLQLAVYQSTNVISSHVTEHCAVIEPQPTYTAVERIPLYVKNPNPFPSCGSGYGHVQLG